MQRNKKVWLIYSQNEPSKKEHFQREELPASPASPTHAWAKAALAPRFLAGICVLSKTPWSRRRLQMIPCHSAGSRYLRGRRFPFNHSVSLLQTVFLVLQVFPIYIYILHRPDDLFVDCVDFCQCFFENNADFYFRKLENAMKY